MMDLKKDFDDMQAAVLQLQHELKLRNETVRQIYGITFLRKRESIKGWLLGCVKR